MKLAAIPAVVFLALGAFFGGALVSGCEDNTAIVSTANAEGAVEATTDPMVCVDLYYKAVLGRNHTQYQFCVRDPKGTGEFFAAVDKLLAERDAKGLKRMDRPVRGRTECKEANGTLSAIVFACSPWSGKEEKYQTIKQGQGWRIVKEL